MGTSKHLTTSPQPSDVPTFSPAASEGDAGGEGGQAASWATTHPHPASGRLKLLLVGDYLGGYLPLTYFDFPTAIRSTRYSEMQSYFRSEYKQDAEWAFNNWLESRVAGNKKKVFSGVLSIFGIFAFLRKMN